MKLNPLAKSARVRAPRMPIQINVSLKTIGTDAAYKMSALNVSKSGLLLESDRKIKVPFLLNTILDMEIDPGSTVLECSVKCLAKVVRILTEDENNEPMDAQYGIQIVQIEDSSASTWENGVTQLENKFGMKASNKIVPPMVNAA